MKLPLMTALAASALIACGPEPSPMLYQPLDVVTLDVGMRQVFVNRTTAQAVVVDATREDGAPALDLATYPVGAAPGATAVAADGDAFYVVDEEGETLLIVDPANGTQTVVELDAPYDRIVVDPHGEFILLHFSGNPEGRIVARNLNEVGVVDLRGATPKATFLTLASRPRSIEFAPPFELAGSPQRIAAVASSNEVTVLDLNELDTEDDALREVPLTVSEADAVRTPRQIEFDVTPTEEDPDVVRVYVLTDASSDITEISIQGAPPSGTERKFGLSVNQLAAGLAPTEMVLLELPGGTRLLSVDGQRPKFTIVDVASGEGATFDLPLTAPARNLLVYQTTTEVDGETTVETRVLAYTPQSPLVAVIRPETISVAGDEPTLGRSVEAIRLERAPSRIKLATDQIDRAIAFHEGNAAGFTILDLRKNHDIPIQGGTLRDVHFDGSFAYAVYQSLSNLTIFGLDGHPTNFDLPDTGQEVFLDTDDALVVVRHPDVTGSFTVLDAEQPTPENARVYENVFLDGLFDMELGR